MLMLLSPTKVSTSRAAALAAIAMTVEMPEGMVKDFVHDRATGVWTLRDAAFVGQGRAVGVLPTKAGPPPLPDGRQLDLQELEDDDAGVGGRLWRGSGALCRWQASAAEQVRRSSILELGCGIGACGLYASALGAPRVALTDGGNDELLANTRANVERNAALLRDGGAGVTVERFLFGEALPGPRYDLVLASDVTYSVNEVRDALCRSARELLLAGSRVVIAHEHRRSDMFDVEVYVEDRRPARWDENDVCLRTFLASALDHGLVVRQLCSEPGGREWSGSGEVRMSTDLSVLELLLSEESAGEESGA